MTLRRLTPDSWRAMTADEAAVHWAVMRGGSRWADADQLAFDTWLAEAEAHRVAMRRAEAAWGVFKVVDDDSLLEPMRRAALAVDRAPSWLRSRAVAAAFVGAVLLAGVVWLNTGGRITVEAGRDAPVARTAPVEFDPSLRRGEPDFATVRGQRLDVTLTDGTQVTLDTDSAIDVAFDPGRRTVRLLKGRAYFDVAHNSARPFVVEAADRQITAVGTQFDVRLDDSALHVLLVTGRVHVDRDPVMEGDAKQEPTVDLQPGDRLTVAFGKLSSIEHMSDMAGETLWRRGLVQFDEAPLGQAVAELNRYAVEPLVIRDRAVAELRVSGVFRTGDPARFARTIGNLLPVRVVATESGEQQLVMSGSR